MPVGKHAKQPPHVQAKAPSIGQQNSKKKNVFGLVFFVHVQLGSHALGAGEMIHRLYRRVSMDDTHSIYPISLTYLRLLECL